MKGRNQSGQNRAIHAKHPRHRIVFNGTEVNNEVVTDSNDFAEAIRQEFETEAEILKQQKIKIMNQRREDLSNQSFVNKLIPDTVEASASIGILGLKATWHPKE